ncbi:unnamed protein product [Aureobasidium vineae]|uniref:Uncharacterized protein n=1 Tax=Aureobasidium vineae TaxID=2773715 RepID=A0A9N8JJ77_9PEZI|nr:unnamed protein product [Aureobasidium vineae]
MPTDWKSIESMERLVAAIIASSCGKTYDAIENRTRVYKKAAQTLVKEAEDAGRMDMNMKKSAAVKSGRVTKRAPMTPSKLKRAVNSDDEDDEPMGNAGTTAGAADEEV